MIPTEGDQKFSVHIKQHVDEIQNRMFSLFDDLIEGKIRSFIISSNQSFVGKTFMTHSILESKNIPYYTINVGSYSNNDFLLTDIIENNKKIRLFAQFR